MVVAIHQPQFLPWVPYFDKADACDLFVHLDNVQFHRRGVQNRNQIKTATGGHWLTVPVSASRETLLRDVRLAEQPWKPGHVRSIELNYARAPHLALFRDGLRPLFEQPWERLSEMNIAMTDWFFDQLGVRCRRMRASELAVSGARDDLLLSICRELGATVYLSGQGGRGYQDETKFERAGIEVRYQVYEPQTYPQCFPETGFVPDLSALDLVLNTGPEAREILLAGRRTSGPSLAV